jgi:hypothetical protein
MNIIIMRPIIWSFTLLLSIYPLHNGKGKKIPRLVVSENRRFFMNENGNPFFWMGDTGWLLFSKLNRKESEKYLDDRAEKGFNVIQVIVLHQLDDTNVYGDSALIGGNISLARVTQGNSFENQEAYDFWDHIDYIVELAQERGLYLALVPVWGSNVRQGKVSKEQASSYAAWLAQRFADKPNIIWLNGGDAKGNQNTDIWEIIGQQIRQHAPNHLMTFHPFGRSKSSMWFHNADWLDFNMFQSGHRRYDQDDTELAYGQDNWKYVRDDYSLEPIKPTLDGEPSYEGIPQGLHDPLQPFWNADDVRRYAYWSVFAGACGFTYGHNAVMQMHKPDDQNPAYGVREYWTEALDAKGAQQMKHLKNLILSKPFFDRIPDQSLIASEEGERYDYQAATRGKDYAFIYTYNGRNIKVKMGKIDGVKISASWFNPRSGKITFIGDYENTGTRNFNPPGKIKNGIDWVLVLESNK